MLNTDVWKLTPNRIDIKRSHKYGSGTQSILLNRTLDMMVTLFPAVLAGFAAAAVT
jgi:hypothetical protein